MAPDAQESDEPRRPGNTYDSISASDQARQHNGNVYNNYSYQYTLRKRRSDETLRHDQRDEALLRAAAEGQAPRVRYLVHLGVDLDHIDDDGFTALHHAALSGFEDVVEILKDAGADVNAQSLDCGTPLHLAAIKARVNVVHLLLRSHANANASSRFLGSPLHCASSAGATEIALALIGAGAECRSSAVIGIEILHRLKGSADPGKDSYSECEPISLAAGAGSVDILEMLVKNNASINTPSRIWTTGDRTEVSFDDAHSQDKVLGIRPLMHAASHGRCDICLVLLDYGSDIDAQDSNGCTALIRAAMYGEFQCLQMLVSNNASLELSDAHGRTVLHWAADSGHAESIRVLLGSGARVEPRSNVDDQYHTPLHLAAYSGESNAVRALVEKGATVNCLDAHNLTPLHYAASYNQLDTVRLLVESGADANIEGDDSVDHMTAFEYAQSVQLDDRSKDFDGVIRFLESVSPTSRWIFKAAEDTTVQGGTLSSKTNVFTDDEHKCQGTRDAESEQQKEGPGRETKSKADSIISSVRRKPIAIKAYIENEHHQAPIPDRRNGSAETNRSIPEQRQVGEQPNPKSNEDGQILFSGPSRRLLEFSPFVANVTFPGNIFARERYVVLQSWCLAFEKNDPTTGFKLRAIPKNYILLEHMSAVHFLGQDTLFIGVLDEDGKDAQWRVDLRRSSVHAAVLGKAILDRISAQFKGAENEWHFREPSHLRYPGTPCVCFITRRYAELKKTVSCVDFDYVFGEQDRIRRFLEQAESLRRK